LEAWYMWELLPPPMLTAGEAAYYLSALFSAIQVLKTNRDPLESLRRLGQLNELHPSEINGMNGIAASGSVSGSQSTLNHHFADGVSEFGDAFLRIAVPNESEGSIHYHTLPIAPKMNVAKLCRMIAHQLGVTNPEDYGLYCLFDGFETCLLASEYPHGVRDELGEKPHLFVYKRNDARIAWPKNAVTTFCSSSATPSIDVPANIRVGPVAVAQSRVI